MSTCLVEESSDIL